MAKVAKLAGAGVITALGRGLHANCEALYSSQLLHQTRQLELFKIPFEAPYFGILEDEHKDPAQHLKWLIDCALEEALSGINLSHEKRRDISVYIGSSSYGIGIGEVLYQQAIKQSELAIPIPLDGFTQVSSHLRQQHGFSGPDYAYNTACSSSANALISAATSIIEGNSKYALVIGLETFNATTLAGFHNMQLLAPSVMRPFDKHRDGLILGEGCGVLLLQAAEAGEAGITICGGASHCDTYSISVSNPDGSAVAEVMQEALTQSQITAADIVAIKAHGTGSTLSEKSEAAGMKQVFANIPPFFSLKASVGHTLGGCGAIETTLMAALLANKKIPASAGFKTPDESLGISPITHPQTVGPGYYMLNFFGFGGNNSSLILQMQ